MVDISPTAAQEIKRIKLSRQIPDSFLRLRVKSGGCSGLFYDLELEQIAELEKTERLLKINNINVIVDSQSWKYIANLKLDYSEDLMGGGFRFHNLEVNNICGCGISFAATE